MVSVKVLRDCDQKIRISNQLNYYQMPYLTRRHKGAADGGRCKKHPKHRQSPGVCSVCLREKLSQIQFPTSPSVLRMVKSSSSCSSDLSSYCSSCSESSYSSPILHHRYRFGNNNNTNYVLTKSKSLAFVPRIMRNKEMMISSNGDGGNKGAGFSWFNLLRPRHRRKRMEHSRTMREGVIITG